MMRQEYCSREIEVGQMVRAGADDPALRAHAVDCAVCAEVLEVAVWMQMLAAIPVEESLSPNATEVWWKAQLLQKWDAQQRAAAPIDIAEYVEVGVALIGALALLLSVWRELPAIMTGHSLMIVVIISMVLFVSTTAFFVRSLLGENGS